MTMTDIAVHRSATASGSPRRAAIDDTTPFALALIPFGLAVGGASAAAGLSGTTALFGAIVLLAGAAQLAAIEVLGSGGSVFSAVLVAGLVNLRFVFYGTGVASWFDSLPLRRRLLLAFPIVDQTFMLCQQRFEHEHDLAWRQRYYVSATVLLGGTFVGCQVIAYRLGSTLPDGLGLHLAAPLTFAGMLTTSLKRRGDVVAGTIAASIVIAGSSLLGPLGLPLGVMAGVSVGALTPTKQDTSPPSTEEATS